MFPIYLGLVGGLGSILFLELVLLLVGCVRAGPVLLEVTNEFRVETDRASDNAHDILGERPGLVGTNYGGVGHCFARTEDTDVIHFVAKARARVTASGRPSGTAKTTSVTEMIKMCVKVIPFSIGVL